MEISFPHIREQEIVCVKKINNTQYEVFMEKGLLSYIISLEDMPKHVLKNMKNATKRFFYTTRNEIDMNIEFGKMAPFQPWDNF